MSTVSTRVSICVDQHPEKIGKKTGPPNRTGKHVELLIIDESELLSATALELLRDRYDRDNTALILIGMPGRLHYVYVCFPGACVGGMTNASVLATFVVVVTAFIGMVTSRRRTEVSEIPKP
jgi:AAA domain